MRRLALLLPLALAACHLVDRRDIWPEADRRPTFPVPPPPALPEPPALVTIRFDTPNPAYREALERAVRQALSAKPGVLFTVNTLVPPAGAPAQQEAALARAANDGRAVGQAILDAGADPGQVELAVRSDPKVSLQEVRVTVQ
jgi:hypothetical protein